MDCKKPVLQDEQQTLPFQMKSEAFNLIHQRRSANYEPNIWKCDFLESLDSIDDEPECKKRAKKLIEDVRSVIFGKAVELDSLAKLELIDSLEKLGLAIHFEVEIKEALATIAISIKQKNGNLNGEDDLYATALCFKLLRQHGYDVSQDMFSYFMDAKTGAFIRKSKHENIIKGMMELLEASHLALEGETFLDAAREFSTTTLEETLPNLDGFLAKQVIHALELPSQKRVQWLDVKWHISVKEKHRDMNAILLELAKLNFNIVQATLQKDLRELSRWWMNLGLRENLTFARDRLVESFVCSVGLACEPEHSCFRKWLTKAINFILIIDDVYDVYGILEELELFTIAVNMWDVSETKMLPECMQICFLALYNTTDDFVNEIQREKGWDQLLPVHVKKVWTDFCNALYVEAKWYTTGYTPSLEEYLSNAWISSSGSVLFAHAFFCLEQKVMKAEEYENFMEKSKDLLYNISVIVRLCNDLGTSSAEVERGDAPSSIVCYMREKNVSEEMARKHIKGMIDESWKKLNGECLTQMPMQLLQTFVNIARVVEGLYHQGDGFGAQDGDKRNKIKSLLLEPLSCSI